MNIFTQAFRWILDIALPRTREAAFVEDSDAATLKSSLPRAIPSPAAHSLFDYRNPYVRALIWEIKYRGNEALAARGAELLHDLILEEASDIELFEGGKPILVPIPLSKERLRERGWNQSELIARKIHELGADSYAFEPKALRKISHTPPQTSFNREMRLKNLAGCFDVPDPSLINGKTIILIDDVITTGATIEEARRTLMKAGARDVKAFTVAH